MMAHLTSWITNIAPRAGENRARMGIAFLLLLLLPWMLIFARAGAEICTAGIGILFLWRSVLLRDWQWLRDPFFSMALLAWLWLMIGVSPFAVNPEKSFLLALPWIRYVVLFAAMRYWLLTTRTAFISLGMALVAMMVFCATDTLWQYVTHVSLTGHPILESGRLTGPLERPKIGIFMARFMLSTFSVLGMLMATASRRTHVALLLGFIYCLVAILFTGERTAFMMIIMAFALITPVLALRIKKLRVYAAVFGTIIVMLLSVLLSTQSGVQETLLRTEEHLEDFSQSPYGQVFAAAIQIGRDHWLTGVGIEGLRELIPQPLAVVVDASSLKEHYMHAHNPYLEWFAEAGLVGLILFMCLVGILMREALQLLRHTRGIASIVPAFMLGACLFNFFPVMSTQSYFSNWTGMMVWYALAIVFSTRNLLAANGTYSSKGIHP